MFKVGDIISYHDMCSEERATLQHGMNFRLHNTTSVFLMSVRANAPYADRIESGGRILIYEGHDIPRSKGGPDPKTVDQRLTNPGGSRTRNGHFFEAAKVAEKGGEPELIHVYEKIRDGVWAFNGVFRLLSAYPAKEGGRTVFKFRLELIEYSGESSNSKVVDLVHDRIIPSSVKQAVYKRDKGKCVECGSTDNLHFDHVLPFSKGGTSVLAENIQLLCARHNLQKGSKF